MRPLVLLFRSAFFRVAKTDGHASRSLRWISLWYSHHQKVYLADVLYELTVLFANITIIINQTGILIINVSHIHGYGLSETCEFQSNFVVIIKFVLELFHLFANSLELPLRIVVINSKPGKRLSNRSSRQLSMAIQMA